MISHAISVDSENLASSLKATGRVERGTIKTGEIVDIVGIEGN